MDEIIEILKEINEDIDYTKEKHLIDDELFVSFDIIQCVADFEDHFGIEIPEEEIVAENFQSAEAMYEMIQRIKG